MATALSEGEIEELWEAYRVKPSAQYVSRVCAVSRNTAMKYIRERNWEERLQKIRDKACTLADTDIAQQLVKDIEMVRDLKIQIADSIQEQLIAGNYKPTVKDYDSLVRLEQFLKGAPDSRSEQSVISFEWLENDSP